jgi:isocitrate lyase
MIKKQSLSPARLSSLSSSRSILLPSVHEVETLRSISVSGITSLTLPTEKTSSPPPPPPLGEQQNDQEKQEEKKDQHPHPQQQQLTKNNYSQYSLSNKIIMSVVDCLAHLCGVDYEWKETDDEHIEEAKGTQERKIFRFHHQMVASNPITELVSICLLLTLPLLSHNQVRRFHFDILTTLTL